MSELKTYVGVKRIQAEPCEKNGKPGYRVIYEPDGYESWSPKDVFEAAYFPLADVTGNSISPEDVDGFFGPVRDTQVDEKTTLVSAKLVTGFVQHEVSSCVDPANYDHALGVQIATDRIKQRVWPMLGFVLQWAKYGLKA